jgi:alpha-tubulin suppressor-like RCC1 family protein
MAQTLNTAMDPTVESGDQLATDWNNLIAAILSCFSGTTRPSYAAAGTVWRDTSVTPNNVNMYDGASDNLLFTINLSTHTVTIPIAAGGTGANTASDARSALGLGALAVLSTVGSSQISAGAVGTTQLADGGVTRAKMASDNTNLGKYLQYDPGSGAVVPGNPSLSTAQLVQALTANTGRDQVYPGWIFLMRDNTIRLMGAGSSSLYNGNFAQNAVQHPQVSNIDPSSLPLTGTFTKVVSSGGTHFAITSDGKLYVTGYNAYGQCGTGGTTNHSQWILNTYFTSNSLTVTNVYVPNCGDSQPGYNWALVLCSNGYLYGFGYNGRGQLGNSNTTDQHSPVRVGSLTNIVGASCSMGEAGHAIAWDSGGTAYAWGYNGYGQLGDGTTITRSSPVTVTGVSNVAEGHAVADSYSTTGQGSSYLRTSSGAIYSTGRNSYGQLGVGDTSDRSAFTLANSGSPPAAASMFVCPGSTYGTTGFLTSDGKVYVCGNNSTGVLGQGNTTSLSAFTRIGSYTGITKAVLGGKGNQVLAMLHGSDGILYTCGFSGYGQSGQQSTSSALTSPAQVMVPNGFESDIITDIAYYGSAQYTALITLHTSGRVCACGAGNASGGVGLGTQLNNSTNTNEYDLHQIIFP